MAEAEVAAAVVKETNEEAAKAVKNLEQRIADAWTEEHKALSIPDKMKKNKMLSIYNYHNESIYLMPFSFEPYVWLFLGLAITVIVVSSGIYNKSNISMELSVTWIIIGIIVIIGTISGAYTSESHMTMTPP